MQWDTKKVYVYYVLTLLIIRAHLIFTSCILFICLIFLQSCEVSYLFFYLLFILIFFIIIIFVLLINSYGTFVYWKPGIYFIRVWRHQRGNQNPYIEEEHGQNKKYNRTKNDLQNIHIKIKTELHEPH